MTTKIIIASPSKIALDFSYEGFNYYVTSLQPFVKIELREIKSQKTKVSLEKVELEGSAIIDFILSLKDKNRKVICLDEKGKNFTSLEFAKLINDFESSTVTNIVFIIGGNFGLSSKVREIADITLKLSSLTLPAHLCFVLLVEQIYRAYCINKGNKNYHK